MNNLYQVLDELRENLLLSSFTNTVTFGEISEVDLDKLTNFPLVHLVLEDAVIDENTIDFTLNVIAADILDVSKELPEDKFLGNNNLQDILNAQLKVITDITNFFRRNDKVASNYITIEDTVRATPFLERFNNQLAGWEASITLRTRMQDKC
jgi:hypothetical protein